MIAEVVMASLVAVIGALGVFTVIDTSTRNTYRAEQSQVLVDRLQAELERVRQMPFGQIAMTGLPAHSATTTEPNHRVNGTTYALARDGTSPMQMVVNGGALAAGGTVAGGTISPAPTAFASGDVTGKVYRYVVWVNDPSCPASLCPGTQDIRRVIVAGTLDPTAAVGARNYQEIHADFVDPDVKPVVNPGPEGEGDVSTYATFWLTDTPCDKAARQDLTGNHATHNTLGTCGAGMKTGSTPGAPDLMHVESPALDEDYPESEQPLFDYATDVEPEAGASADRGLQMRHSNLNGCLFSPSVLDGSPHQKIHRWLAPAVASGRELLLDGEATLNHRTRTINGADHPGKICVWLFKRRLNVLGIPVDTPMVNQQILNLTYFPFELNDWPSGNWSEISVDMDFIAGLDGLLPGERLGLAISVEHSGTSPGDGLEFMYDNPSFDSRLQIKTSSVLPVF